LTGSVVLNERNFACAVPAPCPAPAVQAAPAPKVYALEVAVTQQQPEGKPQVWNIIHIGLACKSGSSAICCTEQAENEYRKGLLQVKATVLKNDRLRVELLDVQARAAKTSDDRIALDLQAKPILERTVKLDKKVKVVLERDA